MSRVQGGNKFILTRLGFLSLLNFLRQSPVVKERKVFNWLKRLNSFNRLGTTCSDRR